LDDLAMHFAARLCDLLGVSVAHENLNRWQGI